MDKKSENGSWAIGGTTLIGTGVGFIFIQTAPLLFVASILVGVGTGLVIASFMQLKQ